MLVYQRVFLNFCCWFLIYSPQFGNQTITSGDGNSVKPSFFVTRGHLPLPYPRYLDEKHTMFNDVQMFDPKKNGRNSRQPGDSYRPTPAWLPASHLLLSTRSSTSTAPENPADLNPTCLGIVYDTTLKWYVWDCLGGFLCLPSTLCAEVLSFPSS